MRLAIYATDGEPVHTLCVKLTVRVNEQLFVTSVAPSQTATQ